MDPRERADALLARARARGAFVVTPEDATSPMDAANTQQIPRSVVNQIDHDEESMLAAIVQSSRAGREDLGVGLLRSGQPPALLIDLDHEPQVRFRRALPEVRDQLHVPAVVQPIAKREPFTARTTG